MSSTFTETNSGKKRGPIRRKTVSHSSIIEEEKIIRKRRDLNFVCIDGFLIPWRNAWIDKVKEKRLIITAQ